MKYTVVSVFPKAVREFFPGLQPGDYVIAPSPVDSCSVLVVEDAYFMRYILDGQQMKMNVSSKQIAEDIVKGFCSSQLSLGNGAKPGLFCVEGEFTATQIMVKFADKIKEAWVGQKIWFTNLVKQADDDWNTFRKHRMISDLQRDAGTILGLKREWIFKTTDDIEEVKPQCPACGYTLLNVDAPVCANCKSIINPKRYKELGLAVA